METPALIPRPERTLTRRRYPGGSECRSIFLTVARAMPNRLAASRWLRPSTWQASRTRRYRSTVYILPPSISKKIEGYRWQSFTPPAAGKSRRFRGLICHRRSHRSPRRPRNTNKMPRERVPLQNILRQCRETVEPFAHVSDARGQPHPRRCRDRDHDDSPRINRARASPSYAPVIRSRWPLHRSISSVPGSAPSLWTAISCASVISTGRNAASGVARHSGSEGATSAKRGSFSQLNTWFAFTSYRRATCETETPRTRVWAQIIRFSSSLQFRRLRRFATKPSDNVHLIANGHYPSLPSGLNETNSSQHQTSYHIEMSGISVNNGRLERDRSVGIYPLEHIRFRRNILH